jgi:hypothetical protein
MDQYVWAVADELNNMPDYDWINQQPLHAKILTANAGFVNDLNENRMMEFATETR